MRLFRFLIGSYLFRAFRNFLFAFKLQAYFLLSVQINFCCFAPPLQYHAEIFSLEFVFALLRPFGYTNLQNNALMQILLYGDEKFPDELNKNVLLLTLQFIHKSGRFN